MVCKNEARSNESAASNSVLERSPMPGVAIAPALQSQLLALARSLTREQALWVSGYFAGIASLGFAEPANMDIPPEAVQAATAVTLLYGSETGNSARIAESLAARLRAARFDVHLSDMANYNTRRLRDERYLFAITSTHGEGAPPQSALSFFEFLESRKAPKLPDLKFAVLALGDSTYEKYCEAGKRLDRRLEELEAVRLAPRVDCDVDYDDPSARWIDALEALLPKEQKAPQGVVLSVVPPPASPHYDKRHPFEAPILENLVLTGRGSSKETRHIELSLDGSGLAYEPGDALGLQPLNNLATVDALLSHTGLDGDAAVMARGSEKSLAQALLSDFEIAAATPRFLEAWSKLSGAPELRRLTTCDTAERTDYLRRHHVIDIMRAYPVPGISAAEFVTALRPLQPRLYSIASSLAASPDEVHLAVATVRYELHGEPRVGIASGHLSRAELGATLPVYIQPNPHFRLPADDASVIMIGAGTGIAPYRAFLQEREARGATGKSWLFFGERNFRTDFLYQVEWQAYLRSGVLSRMDVAFSRDRAEKHYVQHRLIERAADIFNWLEEGAHLYVCGDAAAMAPDVHAALHTIAQEKGGLSPDAAEEYLKTLQRDQRYQRDVY